jgi:hypothetical protein
LRSEIKNANIVKVGLLLPLLHLQEISKEIFPPFYAAVLAYSNYRNFINHKKENAIKKIIL